MTRQVARLGALLMATAAVGCGGNKNQTAAGMVACDPVEGNLPADANVASWAGGYSLTLVATSGDSSGSQTAGMLRLTPQMDELRNPELGSMDAATTMPLIGTVDIDLGAVYAIQMGSLDSEDPLAPGVLVLERHYEKESGDPAAEVTIRFGSEANVRGMTRFDGGYAALFVLQAGSAGIAGNWASGVTGLQSGGHFCAVPLDG